MTASFHLLLPRISSMTEKLSGEAVERRFVMLGQIEPLLGERCQKQARVEFGEATGLGWSAWAAQASDGTDDKVHGIIRAVDPAEWVTGGFVPTFHYYATAEAPDAEFPIFDVDLGLPVGFFETVRRACVDAIADHRPVWLTLKAACDADAPEYRTLAYPPGTILKVTSIELNRSGLRFGDPAGPYPGGHPDEWTPRQRAVVSTVAAIGIQHFRYTIGSSPRFGLSATLYGRAVLAGPKFSRPFIRELKCVVKLEAMTEPRPYVLLEYDWEATKRGYVGSFEIDEGDSGDEELHEPALSLTIFSFGRQGIDRLITVLSGMTAEQPLALSASLVEATSENEIAPEGAPAGPHGWVCDWDFHSEKAAKVVENESPCLMIWCETKEYCRNRRYCQRARRASEA